MNLLFYSAVNAGRFHFPSFRIGQPIVRGRSSNFEAVTKVLLFFRYFAPSRIKQYIDNCRRRNDEAARGILDSLPRGLDDFSTITYMMGSTAIKRRMATLLSCITSGAGPSLINYSFTWSNTPQGRDVWSTLDLLYHDFHHFITDNHIALDLSSNASDRNLYPMLLNDNSLRGRLVPLPETVSESPRRERRRSTVSSIEPEDVYNVAIDPEPVSRPAALDVRYEGDRTYSYIGVDGQRHTVRMPEIEITTSYSFSEGVIGSSSSGAV